jgi:uncharacterized surface protein with fasciclin (FAS1) repeats
MNARKSLLSLATVLVLTGSALAKSPAQSADIVDTAVAAGKFKTLAALVTKAGLVNTLKGEGPFTVLAPTDAAFAKLPKALVQRVTKDKALLTKILTYHVIPGSILSTDLKSGLRPTTVQGEKLRVHVGGQGVTFNRSKVVMADVKASNGVIHAIDTVLLPPSVARMLAKSHH